LEVIRGMIVTSVGATVEIQVPNCMARLPGWTRMEAAGKVLEDIGLLVEGANRVEVRPVTEEQSLMIWYEFPGDYNRASKVFGMGVDG
jgi:hypothetical protein